MNLAGEGISVCYICFLSDVNLISGLSRFVHKQTLRL